MIALQHTTPVRETVEPMDRSNSPMARQNVIATPGIGEDGRGDQDVLDVPAGQETYRWRA